METGTDIRYCYDLDLRQEWSECPYRPDSDYQSKIKTLNYEYHVTGNGNPPNLSASTGWTCVTGDGQTIESYFDDPVHIIKYCFARIYEIEKINQYSHTPSAYVCILTFLSFLAQAMHNATRDEEAHFKAYCNKHLRHLRCRRSERSVDTLVQPSTDINTWGAILYKLVRCGLVHAMSSSGNRAPQQNQIEVRLTHSTLKDAETYEFVDSQNNAKPVTDAPQSAVTVTVCAFDLIDAVRDSIVRISIDSGDMENMRRYFKAHPPLLAVVEKQK